MTERRTSTFLEIVLPFIIFTSVWGSTWIVIRDQLGAVPAQWSVSYRFVTSWDQDGDDVAKLAEAIRAL